MASLGPLWKSEGLIVPRKPGNSGGGREPWFGHSSEREGDRELTMSLEPDQVERLRKKLYEKAKREPDYRFYTLYDKVCWPETLAQAYRQAKANAGAAGVDGVERGHGIDGLGIKVIDGLTGRRPASAGDDYAALNDQGGGVEGPGGAVVVMGKGRVEGDSFE